ncbi:MAG: DNA polymerase III subunit beta [Clostridia bacterium]|nr:DNA polymerase III subunit beta [Clostridia bacterium]
MKFICDGILLSDAVIRVSKALVSKSTDNNILEGILLTARGEELTLNATDTEFSIQKTIKADIDAEGSIVVPGKFLNELVRKLTNEKIEMELCDNNIMKIRYSDSEVKVQCFDSERFPAFLSMSKPVKVPIVAGALKEIVEKIGFCVSEDDSRPILKGCKFDIEGDCLTAVSLDGYRMMVVNKQVEKNIGAISFIVPGKCLKEISKILDDDTRIVNLEIEKNFLLIELADTKLAVRLIVGEYINYRQIIPTQFTTEVTAQTNLISNALERIAVIGSTEKANTLVYITLKEGNMEMFGISGIGRIVENLAVKKEGKDLLIAFDVRYLLDFIRAEHSDFIHFKFGSSNSPAIIVPSNEDKAKEFLYLVLPVRITQKPE